MENNATAPKSFFADYANLIGKFRLPAFDYASVLESRRKDVEALAALNTTALAGMQSLGQKQAEIVQSTMTKWQSLVTKKDASATEVSAGAGEAVREALVKSVSNVQELAQTVYKAQADSFAVVSRRIAENVEEFKALLQPKQ